MVNILCGLSKFPYGGDIHQEPQGPEQSDPVRLHRSDTSMATTHDSLGISEARSQLGTLVARAVHGRRHTTISRSTTERAVLISEEEFKEYVRLKQEREAAEVRAEIDAAARGELDMTVYTSREEAYADLGLGDAAK